MLRVPSTLPENVEKTIERTIGCCVAVHRELGPGLLESIYARATAIELDIAGIAFEVEKPVAVCYRDRVLCHQRIDLVVEGQVVVEIKSSDKLHPLHVAQVMSYLRVTKLRVGLLVNFNVPLMREGIRRIVL